MTVQDFFFRTPLIDEAMDHANRIGMQIQVGHDFREFDRILQDAKGHEISMPFDPDLHKLNEYNAFWLVGRTSEGVVAHTQAVRLYDMSRLTLGEYLEDNFRGFPPAGVPLNLAASRYRAGPGARRIRGRVCYHGEMWLDETAGEFRGKGASGVLTRLGFLLTIQNLAPDYIFALMSRMVACKGLPQRAGFMHTEPGALSWQLADSDRAIEGFMAYMSMEDLRFLLRLPMEELVA